MELLGHGNLQRSAVTFHVIAVKAWGPTHTHMHTPWIGSCIIVSCLLSSFVLLFFSSPVRAVIGVIVYFLFGHARDWCPSSPQT